MFFNLRFILIRDIFNTKNIIITMKYLYLLLIIFLLTSCSSKENIKEDYNYLEDNSIRFIKMDNDVSLLINSDNKYYLLLLNEQNINISIDYLIKLKDVETNSSNIAYLLDDELIINDLVFRKNDKIEIILNNKNFCIYLKELDNNNYSKCDFIYLYNPDSSFYIDLDSNLLILFYDAYTKFNYRFMHELAEVWIDSYTISNNSYTTLTIYDDNFRVTSYKIRGKTIHKK